jgi:hypothetical protein
LLDASGRAKKQKLQYATRSGSGIVEDEVKAYLLCIDSEEFFDRNGESEVLRHIAAKSVIPAGLQAILVHNPLHYLELVL